ncbi:Bestrophin-3 [Biomphalaria glabrata]|nr:bestrophin-2-like [Biomphalaria glabrata]
MTIIYQNRVATTSLGGFLKLLKTWRGSVYKLMYKELIIFCVLYLFISLIYRLALPDEHKRVFEKIAIELRAASNIIPLSFILGFYVSFIVERWWTQFINVPWPDRTLFVMAAYLHGTDERSRMMRRAVARYVMFALILICRNVSVSVMKRFPTLDHIVTAGFVTKEEIEMYEKVKCRYIKFWVPMVWANQVLVTARREGRIQTDFGLRMIIEYLADIRDKCSIMFVYDWITVPLVYTQVVTFAVYSYFATALIGQQYLDPGQKYEGYEGDFYFPGFTILQFLFYMGWLKVAEQMINPFGEDDDDFDINWLLDRHTDVAFCLTDQCYGFHPPFIQDGFWGDVSREVPYTESSLGSIRPNFMGTTFGILNPDLEAEDMIFPEHEETGSTRHRKNSLAESVLSALRHRNSRPQVHHGSHVTITSQASGVNGTINRRISFDERRPEIRRSSIDIPLRHVKEAEFTKMQRKRKMSLPMQINLFHRNKPKRTSPMLSPRLMSSKSKQSLGRESDVESEAFIKSGESTHTIISYSSEKISRPPILSAIEEIKSLPNVPSAVSMRRMMLDYGRRGSSLSDDDSDVSDLDIGGGDNVSIRENKYSEFMESAIQEVEEEYVTAAEANSPTYSYLDQPDLPVVPPENRMGRKRSTKDEGNRRQ